MPNVATLEPENAPADVRDVYSDFQRRMGFTLEMLVSKLDGIKPEKARDIILFGIKCARDPQGLDLADYDQLRRHGLNQSEIVEAVSMSALAVYANIIADATGMPADEMFSQF